MIMIDYRLDGVWLSLAAGRGRCHAEPRPTPQNLPGALYAHDQKGNAISGDLIIATSSFIGNMHTHNNT